MDVTEGTNIRTGSGQNADRNRRRTYVGYFRNLCWSQGWFVASMVQMQCPALAIDRKKHSLHDAEMNEASYQLQRNEAGRFKLNVSLFMGASIPRKWVKVDLETKDRENAETRTHLILRFSYRLGLFPAGEVPVSSRPLPGILTLN